MEEVDGDRGLQQIWFSGQEFGRERVLGFVNGEYCGLGHFGEGQGWTEYRDMELRD